MTEKDRELISALVDDELAEGDLDEVLDVLSRNRTLRDTWGRYHLIHDALSGNLEDSVNVTLYNRISAAIEREPQLFVPPQKRRWRHSWWGHLSGLAVAASITGVVVFGVQRMAQEQDGVPLDMDVVMKPSSFVYTDKLITLVAEYDNGGDYSPYPLDEIKEYSVRSGVNGMMPYVRIVGRRSIIE